MPRIFVGAGSNLGDRAGYLRFAREALGKLLEGLRWSPLYETAPRDYEDQGDFLNCVFYGTADYEPLEFLDRLQELENRAGRIRTGIPPKGPRVLDLDILLWDRRVMNHPRLTLPHPAMSARAFVLVPLLALDPGLEDPRTGRPYGDFLTSLEDQAVRPVDFSPGMW